MKISVLLHTSTFRGDHEADVCEAHDLLPGETVEQLVERLIPLNRTGWSYYFPHAMRIELRQVCAPPEPVAEGGQIGG